MSRVRNEAWSLCLLERPKGIFYSKSNAILTWSQICDMSIMSDHIAILGMICQICTYMYFMLRRFLTYLALLYDQMWVVGDNMHRGPCCFCNWAPLRVKTCSGDPMGIPCNILLAGHAGNWHHPCRLTGLMMPPLPSSVRPYPILYHALYEWSSS